MATSKTVICSETEIEMHRILYNWEIKNFDRICTPESEEFEPISSNPFRAGQQIQRDSEWDLILSAEGGYLQIWLYLKKIFDEHIKDISVNLTVLVLKADGTTLLRRRCDKNQTFTSEDNGWGMGYIITIETLWEQRDQYLLDNKLRLQIQLDILGDLKSKIKTPFSLMQVANGRGASSTASSTISSSSSKRKRANEESAESLRESSSSSVSSEEENPGFTVMKKDFKKLFKSHIDTDLTIECGKKNFPVHKLILSARSKVFAAMLRNDHYEESRSNVVKIPDISEGTMEKLLEYIYTGDVAFPPVEKDSGLDESMALVAAGDKYQMGELKNRGFRFLCANMKFENVGKLAILAYLHNAEDLVLQEIKRFCTGNWKDLLKHSSFRECLISTPRAFFEDAGFADASSDSD